MKPDNPSAFPWDEQDQQNPEFTWQHHEGMTLRDYFAAKAITAVMTGHGYDDYSTPDDIARVAYLIADAMLTQRQQ